MMLRDSRTTAAFRTPNRRRALFLATSAIPLALNMAVCVAWAQTTEPASVVLPATSQPADNEGEAEVASFFLQGKQPWQRLKISDLDLLLLHGKERLVPLRRLLKTTGIQATYKDNKLAFLSPTESELGIDERTARLLAL